MKKIKIIVYLLGFALLTYYSGVFMVEKIKAAEVTGWLWGGSEDATIGGRTCTYGVDATDPACKDGNETGVGWISMSRKNCDPDGDGIVEGGSSPGTKYLDCPGGQPITQSTSYGVVIPDDNTNVTGYAWSENLGWIDFNPAGPYPSTTPNYNYSVKRNGDYLEGWARIVSIPQAGTNAGGWQGWIKMRGSNYGVQISKMSNDQSTYAWSDELGWIDFKQAQLAGILKICRDSCNGGVMVSNGSTINMYIGDTRNLKACYNSSAACDNSSGDVTNVATWNETNTPKDVVSLSGTITKVVTANDDGDEGISVTYGSTINFNVHVYPPVDCYSCDTSDYSCDLIQRPVACQPEEYTNHGQCVSNCKAKPTKWQEVGN